MVIAILTLINCREDFLIFFVRYKTLHKVGTYDVLMLTEGLQIKTGTSLQSQGSLVLSVIYHSLVRIQKRFASPIELMLDLRLGLGLELGLESRSGPGVEYGSG